MTRKIISYFKYFLVLGFLSAFFHSYSQEVAPFTPRLNGGNIEIRGDIVLVGNNILNRASESNPAQANTPYNGTANNNSLWMEYIDIDGDASTFSSSSAELNINDPSCSQVRYAGLYWAATYPNERSTNGGASFSGTPRIEDWFNIKFRVPGGAYVDLTADTAADPVGQEDDIIYDGYDYSNINNSFKDSPYICYKNVTDLVRSNSNPNGEYTVANVRATKGRRNGSSSAGWVMVIIYENPNESGKFISTFDGYAGMSSAAGNVDVGVNGFRTLPTPFPVRARVGVAALEGDRGITNDRFFIRANSSGSFTNLSTGLNPANNFFNSTITNDGNQVPTRTPYGTNTLGTDIDLFTLNNPLNSVLPNSESGATLRFTSTGDGYGSFLAAFAVEIIEPNIVLEKKVEDISGNDITGQGVHLGQLLDYVLSFENIGNDDAINYTIRDVLPINVALDESNITMPTGASYAFNAATREVTFSIPDYLVDQGDPIAQIRMRVQVAENCFDFIDACSDLIQNLAYSTYRGAINSNQITDDPSVTDFDNCGFIIPGATNFLLDDLADCSFSRTVQLCGDNVTLDAGDNFDDYVWKRDDNGNGLFDATDTTITDGDPDNDPSTLQVDDIGTYIVDKIVADPCKGFKEIIIVERFGTVQTNPIVDYFNNLNSDADPTNDIQGEIAQCSVDGDLLPNIFLCGSADSQLLQINITDAHSLTWERLDESSCSAAPDDCANKNLTCQWDFAQSGSNFNVGAAGKYRLVVSYQNGCFSRFYFDVYQNSLDVLYNSSNIICNTDGNITITNLGSNYGYQLVDVANGTIVVPFSANNGPSFDIDTNGAYRVDITQLDTSGNPIPNACIFSTPDIGILERDFQVNVETTPANCNAQGAIKIDILNIEPNYTYVLRRDDGTLIDDETAQANNTHTFNVNQGDYIIEASSEDGCSYTENVTVTRTPDPTITALTISDIGCTAGLIQLTGANGYPNPDYYYAIWSRNGVNLYPDVASIPGDAYATDPNFIFGWRDTDADGIDEYFLGEDGTYSFVIVDSNNCFAFSNEVTISDNGTMSIDSITETQPSCSGDTDGEIVLNTTGGVAPFQYSIDGGATYQSSTTFVNLTAGSYEIRVLDSSGCDQTQTYILSEPFPLSASAGVSRDATCDPNGAEVRVTNVTGGSGTYQYSFDGGVTYGASSTAVLPPGDYTVIVDDGFCEYPMNVTVEDVPEQPEVTLTPEVNYNCDGTGTITATPNIATYNYTYALDGVLNSPDPTSNVFDNVVPGTYTVTTYYTSQTPPIPSVLLSEDFGSGETIQSPNTNGYGYEDQTTDPPGDNNRNVNDFEYTVTSDIVAPFGAWINPIDHTTGTRASQGRYLVMNVGTPTPAQIIYSKQINDVIPNQDLSVSLYIINLMRQGTSGLDPDLTIEIRESGTSNVVQSIRTGIIPKNTGAGDWVEFTATLNPGANTTLDFVIRSEIPGNGGNDFALDDIIIHQVPEVCEQSVETPVAVIAGNVFTASITGSTHATCNGDTDATLTIEAANFDAVAGFEYSINGSPFISSIVSPVTTSAPLGAGNHTIVVRKADEITCSRTLNHTITEPDVLIASAAITTALTCTNGGAAITASAVDGTPGYEYQLEDMLGGIIAGLDFATNGNNTVFTGLTAGDYVVRVRDANFCEDTIDAALTVSPINPIIYNVTATSCYPGGNTATIQIDVTDGNGDYTFSLNGNPWVVPSPSTASTYTFTGLSNGPYTVNVQDGLGCTGTLQTLTIDPQLTVSASASNITACANSTDISITASGGDTNYVYAVVPNGTTVTDGDFNSINPVNVTTAGDYDIYVRDNNGAAVYCSALQTITVVQDAPLAFTPTPTDVTCFGGSGGSISIVGSSGGNAPFMYSIDNGATYVTGNTFPNLTAGTYPVRVRDSNNCESPLQNVTINEPAQLVAEATITQIYTCTTEGEITVGSITPTSGGSGDYQYSINGGAWTVAAPGGHTFTSLTDGTYSIRVRDANAITCGITLADIIIAPLPTEPILSTTVTYSCEGTGTITVLPNDPSYTYSLNGGAAQASNIFTNIPVGLHTITVDYGSNCTVDTNANVENGNAFEASIVSFENLDCNADGSGTITIDADNYGAGGYEYSLNGNPFVGPFSAPEQIAGLSAQAYTIEVRDVLNPIAGCTVTLNQNLTEPTSVLTTASITEEFTCENTGATITASVSGGTPIYEYQLEDNLGGIIAAYQGNDFFTAVPAGDYIVSARDINGCEDAIDTPVTVTSPVVPTFTTIETACYFGANNASIQVDVTAGNGNYIFSLDGGPFITPSPSSATTYTFSNLSNGTYTIDVRDGYGCAAIQQTVTIEPQLVVSIDVDEISACADGTITVNAYGGDGNFVYAFVPANTSPSGLYGPSNTFNVTNAMATANPAGYDVYVQDHSGVSPSCSFSQEDIILIPSTPLTVTGTPTDPECFDGLGSIDAAVAGGSSPFTYQLVDLSPADGIDYGNTSTNVFTNTLTFNGIGVGDYELTITDEDSCTVTSSTITINNAVEITADINPILPAACNDPDPNEYGFEFDNVITPVGGTVEYSADGGATWQLSNELRGYVSGTEVFPSIRTTLSSGTICQRDFDRYIIPYPLDNLDISISAIVVNCNDLQVRVQGTAGVAPYEYAYSENPANFNPAAATWQPGGTVDSGGSPVPAGHGAYTWTGLTPGRTYVFYVRDDTGCVRQSLVNVNDLITRPIEIAEDIMPTCFGGSTGEITYTINPGTPSSHMRWEFFEVGNPIALQSSGGNIPFNNTINVNGLSEGEYYIEIVQSDGTTDACTGGSENSYLLELNPISATANATRDISCNLPGLITVESISGGGGAPYTFDITGPAGFTALTGVTTNPIGIGINSPAGNYTVTMYDQYGCSATLAPVNLNLSPNPTITSVTQDNCNAPIDLTVVGNSAAGHLRYAIVVTGNPVPSTYVDNGGVFNNVIPGDYDIYVMDGNGCIASQPSYTVHPVLSANVQLTKLLDCTASPDAIISIEALDGSGSYEYSITNTAGAPSVAQTAFPSNPFDYNAPLVGDYTITVYDTNTPNSAICNRSFTITVPDRVAPVVESIATTDVTCHGDSNGTITITVTNSPIGPFTFEITSFDGAATSILPTSTTNNTATFTGLAPTTTASGYIVTITADPTSNNCTVNSGSITISEPSAVAVTMAPTVEFACVAGNNENNASITVQNTTGGSNNFVRYEFINDLNPGTPVQDGPEAMYIETDFAGGNYTINVYDDNGCAGTATASIAPFDELQSATVTVDQAITCASGENITINAFGLQTDSSTLAGLTNYEFRELPGGAYQASNIFTNLATGTHSFEVRNVHTNCVISVSHTVGEPNNFEITVTSAGAICHGTDGTVSFTIADAVNPYTNGFSWQIYNSQGTATTADDTIILGANGVSANVGPTTPFAIGAGEYKVEITQDANPSCVSSELFNIAGPSDPIAANTDVAEVTCSGNDGVIEIIDAQGGWGSYTYFVAPTTDPVPTFPGSYSVSPRFTGLAGGAGTGTDYQVWVADQNGCEFRLPNVNLVDPTPITADLRVNQPNCTDLEGEIEVINVLGGQSGNYSYQLQVFNTATTTYDNLRSVQSSPIFSGLGAGQYQVIVSDQWNCSNATSGSIALFGPIVPLATIVKTIDCSTADPGGQITITQTGGSGTFNYSVLYPDGVTTASNTTGVFTGLTQDSAIGEYVFTITDQALGHACSTTIGQSLDPEIIPVINVDNSTNVTCNGADDGTITVSTTNSGVGPYTFRIIAGNGSSPGSPILPTTSSNSAATFTGLTGSTSGISYTIEVRGTNNCAITTDVPITEEDPITVNATSIVQYGCTNGNNTNNATVSFNGATGGTGTYVRYVFLRDGIVVQDGANTAYNETDGIGGVYELRVYDAAGCSSLSAGDTIIPFTEISDPTVTTIQDAACNPLNNAEIEVGITLNPAASTPNLEYTVNGMNVTYSQTINSSNASETFTGLEFGNYQVTITNLDTGCTMETVHTIEDPDVIEVIATKLTDEECLNDGFDDGSFSITINNYSGGYSYQVYDVNDNPIAGMSGTGNTATALPPFNNLPGGVYYVRVTATNAPHCDDDSNTVTILAPSAPITATIMEQANVTCSNDQGSILVDPTGGEGPYTVVLDNTTTSQIYTETNVEAFIFTGLSAGSFHVTVTDAFGCVLSDNIDLIRPDDIVANISATTLSCFNDNTASVTATVNPRNISPVYQYQLNVYDDAVGSNLLQTSTPQSGTTFNGLAAGFYSITVTDDVSCSDETLIVEIVNPTEVEAQLIRTSPLTCTTGVEFELSATGGSGTYEYSDDNATWLPMTGNNVNLPLSGMLSAGVYRYYVRDAVNMCTAVLSNSIEEDVIDPLILTVDTSAAVINCNGDNTATIYADAEGGLGNYQYELYTDVSLNPATRIAGPQPLGEFRNLYMGTYYINVFSGDCTTPAQRVDITEPAPLEYTDEVINVSCNGEEDGSITVRLSGGSGNYQYAISPNLDQFDNENIFEDLAPGDYTVIAQDNNGCFMELDYTITAPTVIEVETIILPEVCEGEENGSIEFIITGGTGPYSTRMSDESAYVQDRSVISGLAAGSYIIFIQDANGCEENVFVTVEPGVNLNAAIEPVYGCNGDTANNYVNILLEDESIANEVLYGLDTVDPSRMQLNPFFRDISSGTHYISISHENGCIVTHEFEIEHYDPLTLTLSQGNINEIVATVSGGREDYTIYFGDTNNGADNTYYINRTDVYVVTVIDANGCEVSASIEMEFIDIDIPNFFTPNGDAENQFWKPKNDEGFPQILTIIFDRYGREVYRLDAGDRGWDGTYQQKELPTGDYWYIIKLRGENDPREFVGHFTLYR